MQHSQRSFEQSEYDDRLLSVRTAMAMAGLDALLLTDPSNQAWVTGYNAWTFQAHQAVIVTQEADPIWWGRGQDVGGAAQTTWMPEGCVLGYADAFHQSAHSHPMEDLVRHLDSLGIRSLGVEMDSAYFSAKAFSILLQALPNVGFADATNLVNWQRIIKSETEIEHMRKAAQLSETIMASLFERAHVGLKKSELIADTCRDAIIGTPDVEGDFPAMVPLLSSGTGSATARLPPEPTQLLENAATSFHISGCYRRYHAPFSRTVFLGTPSDAFKRAESAVLEALEAGLNAARPGRRACDVAQAINTVRERSGQIADTRCGYSVGLGFPPDWAEGTASLRAEDETELEADMTFHLTPAFEIDGCSIGISETIRISAEGPAESFCTTPRNILVKL